MKFLFKMKYADYPKRVQQQVRQQKNLVLEELRKPMAETQKQVELLTRDWKEENQPNLSIKMSNTGWEMKLSNDKIFQIVSAGSKKHLIRGKRGNSLVFSGPHRMYSGDRQSYPKGLHMAATMPKSLTPARPAATYKVTAMQTWAMKTVIHPGFKPRGFIQIIEKNLAPEKVEKLILKALKDGAEAFGL